MDSECDSDQNLRRHLRPRSVQANLQEKKKSFSKNNTSISEEPEDIEDFYRQDSTKLDNFRPSSLETIYESPKGKSSALKNFMGIVKLRRQCRFPSLDNPSKIKAKLRKNKSRKLKRIGAKVPSGFKITIDHVKEVLHCISDDENEENNQPFNHVSFSLKDTKAKENKSSPFDDNLNLVSSTGNQKFDITDMNVCKTKEANNVDYDDPLKVMDRENFDTSPCKIKINKGVRQRRRSGLVKIDHKTVSEFMEEASEHLLPSTLSSDAHRDSAPLISFNESTSYKRKSPNQNIPIPFPMSVPIEESQHFLDHQDNDMLLSQTTQASSNSLSPLSSKFSKSKKNNTKRTKARRNSGINKSIYKDISLTPSPEPIIASDEKMFLESSYNQDLIAEPLASASSSNENFSPSMMEKLQINSPGIEIQTQSKRIRRKSARLSFGGADSVFGSLWVKKPSKNDSNSPIPCSQKTLFPSGEEQTFGMSLQIPLLSENSKTETIPETHLTPSGNTEVEKMDDGNMLIVTEPAHDFGRGLSPQNLNNAISFDDSPVLCGMFDGRAQFFKGKKLILKKGSHINMKHFIHREN